MKAKQKKPTNKDIVTRVNFLLYRIDELQNYMNNLLELVNDYIEFNGDVDKFKEHIKKENSKKNLSRH